MVTQKGTLYAQHIMRTSLSLKRVLSYICIPMRKYRSNSNLNREKDKFEQFCM